MEKRDFEDAVREILAVDKRYHGDAYLFVREALELTLDKQRGRDVSRDRHVSGGELLEGFRVLALREFGPMALLVLEEWGLKRCVDVGHVVFNLIDVGVLGKTASDTIDDFRVGYDFAGAFRDPFLPSSQRGSGGAVARV